MFDRIYNQRRPILNTTDREAAGREALAQFAARFNEELGEVAEAMRLEYFYKENLRNEIADINLKRLHSSDSKLK